MVVGESSGGSHRIPRETPFAEILVHRKCRADRRESRRTHRLARERAEPVWLLSGHDESVSDGDDGAGEDFRGRRIFRSQIEDRLFAAEYGGGSRIPRGRTAVARGAGAMAGWSGEGSSETVGVD